MRKETVHSHKSIGNSSFIKDLPFSAAHDFKYKVKWGKTLSIPDPVLRLNHYWTKSLEEWNRKGSINSKGYMADKETLDVFKSAESQSNDYLDEGEILVHLEKSNKENNLL